MPSTPAAAASDVQATVFGSRVRWHTAAASLVPALEGLLVIAVVGVTAMRGLLPSSASIGPMAVSSIRILIIWVAGMLILNKVRSRPELSFSKAGETAEASEPNEEAASQGQSTRRTINLFVIASLATLIAGVALEQTGNQLADNFGINGVTTDPNASTVRIRTASGTKAARLKT